MNNPLNNSDNFTARQCHFPLFGINKRITYFSQFELCFET